MDLEEVFSRRDAWKNEEKTLEKSMYEDVTPRIQQILVTFKDEYRFGMPQGTIIKKVQREEPRYEEHEIRGVILAMERGKLLREGNDCRYSLSYDEERRLMSAK